MKDIIILSAFIIDVIFGDPELIFPHPIVAIGSLINKLENIFFKTEKFFSLKISGFIFVLSVIALSLVFLKLILFVFSFFNIYLNFLFISILVSFGISLRSLHFETKKVVDNLKKGDIDSARTELSMLVSRDTRELEERDIIRSVIETVAENITDGIIAPLFYYGVAGIYGMFFYKTVNTLDSMIGYKNDKYCNFGMFAAKLDDVINFIPARIAGFLVVVSAFVLRYDFKQSFSIILRDRKNIDSPNSGWTEAAVAGALNIRLGGPTPYFGVWHDKPYIGDEKRNLTYKHIEETYLILYTVSVIFMVILLCVLK